MPAVGFEPAILARDRRQTHALVRPPGSAKYILLAESQMIQYTTKHLPVTFATELHAAVFRCSLTLP